MIQSHGGGAAGVQWLYVWRHDTRLTQELNVFFKLRKASSFLKKRIKRLLILDLWMDPGPGRQNANRPE
jgi:hypothetical protein